MHPQPLTPYHHSPSRSPRSWTRHDYLELGAYPSAPGCARGHARNVLREWGLAEFADVTQMVVSELVSNAVEATRDIDWMPRRPPVRLWVHARPCLYDTDPSSTTRYSVTHPQATHRQAAHRESGLLILVWDAAGGCPAPREAGWDEESGRGLAIVAALSADWGHYHPDPRGPGPEIRGKVTWAHVTTGDL